MTEAEWLRCTEPREMLREVQGKISSRKLRLFVCACCRKNQWLMSLPGGAETVQAAEAAADGTLELSTVSESVTDFLARSSQNPDYDDELAALPLLLGVADADEVARRVTNVIDGSGLNPATRRWCVDALRCLVGRPFPPATPKPASTISNWLAKATGFVNMIASSPLRRSGGTEPTKAGVPFVEPSWLTSTVTTISNLVYESGDFGPMPILADALQDAGCTSEDILEHCRDANAAHVRGCWVVDLVLGKA